jgi:hypothetical protein
MFTAVQQYLELAGADSFYGSLARQGRELFCDEDFAGQGDLVAETAKEVRAATPAGRRPAFLHLFAINWWSKPSDLAAMMAALGDDYVACTPNQFVDLWRQSQAK